MRNAIFALALCLSLTATAANAAWSERGMFVFDGIYFDLKYKFVSWGPLSEALDDCSDQKLYCATAETFTIVVPKTCDQNIDVGQSWTLAGNTTRVVYRRTVSFLLPARKVTQFFLVSNNNNHVVYVYSAWDGVTDIYFSDDIDFVKLIKSGRYARGLPERSIYRHSLATADPFGLCRGVR